MLVGSQKLLTIDPNGQHKYDEEDKDQQTQDIFWTPAHASIMHHRSLDTGNLPGLSSYGPLEILIVFQGLTCVYNIILISTTAIIREQGVAHQMNEMRKLFQS